jgi:hypothetical protein
MIPTNPDAIKKLQEKADRNIARGDWEDDFGLEDRLVPKPVSDLLKKFGKTKVPNSK